MAGNTPLAFILNLNCYQGRATLTEQISSTNSLPPETIFESPAEAGLSPPFNSKVENSAPKQLYTHWQIALRVSVLLLAMGIMAALYLTIGREQIIRFQQYGYFGIFLTSLIGNASIALPIPSLFFTFVGGATFNWVIVGLVSGIGEALGESTGYMAGYGGSALVENQKMYKRIQGWMERNGLLTIFVLSVVPNPIIDLAGIAAGASKFGYFKFLTACWAGKTIKTLVFAWAGAHSMVWLLQYIDGLGGF